MLWSLWCQSVGPEESHVSSLRSTPAQHFGSTKPTPTNPTTRIILRMIAFVLTITWATWENSGKASFSQSCAHRMSITLVLPVAECGRGPAPLLCKGRAVSATTVVPITRDCRASAGLPVLNEICPGLDVGRSAQGAAGKLFKTAWALLRTLASPDRARVSSSGRSFCASAGLPAEMDVWSEFKASISIASIFDCFSSAESIRITVARSFGESISRNVASATRSPRRASAAAAL